jgi:hypothetical protein
MSTEKLLIKRKRDLFEELLEGIAALSDHRQSGRQLTVQLLRLGQEQSFENHRGDGLARKLDARKAVRTRR